MIIHLWHTILDMPKKDRDWHVKDVQEEFKEYKEAHGFWDRWSEKSDVVYAYTRARWSGYRDIDFPMKKIDFLIGALYMFPKFTLRWLFFYLVGKRVDKSVKVTAVRNPYKRDNLRKMAERHNLDPEKFEEECNKLLKFWVFLK